MEEQKQAEKPMSVHLADKAKLLANQILLRQAGVIQPDNGTITSPQIDDLVDTIIQAAVMRVGEFQRMAQMEAMKKRGGLNRAGKPDEVKEQP